MNTATDNGNKWPRLIGPGESIGPHPDFFFMRDTRLLPVHSGELYRLVPVMPIVLHRQEENWTLCGVMSLGNSENLLLGPHGGWRPQAMPTYLQTWPLGLARTRADGEIVLAQLRESPRLAGPASKAGGEGGESGEGGENADKSGGNGAGRQALTDGEGAPTDLYRQLMAMLLRQEEDRPRVQARAEALHQAGCLEQMKEDGPFRPRAGDIFVSSPRRVEELSEADQAELLAVGALPLVYAIFFSSGNILRFRRMIQMRGKSIPERRPRAQPDRFLGEDLSTGFNFDNL